LLLAAALLAIAPLVAQAKPAEDTARRLKALEQKIEASDSRYRDLNETAGALRGEIEALRSRLIETAARIQNHEDKSAALEDRLAELSAREQDKAADLARRARQLANSLAALERLSQQPAGALIARPGAIDTTARSASLLGTIVPRLRDTARKLGAEIADLKQLRADIDTERQALDQEARALARDHTELDQLVAQKKARQSKMLAAAAREKSRLAALARKAKSLRALVARLERERLARPQTEVPITGLPFSRARGTLPLPARGRVIGLFGKPDRAGLPARGVRVATRPNAQVVAPYDGRVVFADRFRDYGQLLIIAHGEGYHTLLAGLSRIDVVVGQWLLAGEPIGRMGGGGTATGGGRGTLSPVLYVELRRKGEPINPLPWLAASERKVSG
jgi:septal ring factor EnvC (AmiA/AmiB activator)